MQAKSGTLLSVVVPLFNEETNLKFLYSQLKQVEQELAPIDLEIIFVDDCSADQTPEMIRELCYHNPNVRLIRFAKNSGSHAAIMAGIVASKGDCVMFMAGDLQDPPKLIPEMLDKWRQGNGIVWAARTQVLGQKKQDTFFSSLYWKMVYYTANFSLPMTGVDFFLIDRLVVDAIAPQVNRNVPSFMLVAETGFKTAVVYYTKGNRGGGKSGWTLKKKLALVLETLLFSPVALRAGLALGGILAASAILTFCILLSAHLVSGCAINGFLVVVIALALFAGVELVMLGLVGEYLFLALKEARQAPRFVVAEKVNFDCQSSPEVKPVASATLPSPAAYR